MNYRGDTWDAAAAGTLQQITDWTWTVEPKHAKTRLQAAFHAGGGHGTAESVFLELGKWAHGELQDVPDGDPEYIVRLLAMKHHDYGPDNINGFGVPGVLIRLHDKVCRYENLVDRYTHVPAVTPFNESLIDTLIDIVGYCVVGLMVLDGTFDLPLAVDVQQATYEVDPAGVASRA